MGLVLSGGGSRGAYELGVLRYIREIIRAPSRFSVVTGSSVGAINAAYLAATCDRPRVQLRSFIRVWLDLRLDDVYRFGWTEARTIPQVLFGRNLPRTTHGSTLGGLVNAGGLQHVVRNLIPWRGIAANLAAGHLDAVSCSATELDHGMTTIFVQTRAPELPPWPPRSGQLVVPTAITADHALASAAIPVLFPAVRIGDRFYVDGSLRQNTPIHPALALGAERLLVIGLRHATARNTLSQPRPGGPVFPHAVFLVGKLLNALMLDKLEADIARIRRTNDILDAGERSYGPDFAREIAEGVPGRHGRPYRKIAITLIQPSVDLGEIAWDVIRQTKLASQSGMAARWLRRLTEDTDAGESDLASYLLFDREYVGRLIELGYADARAQHDELEALFG